MTTETVKRSASIDRDQLPFVTGKIGFSSALGSMDNAPQECRFYDARPIVDELSLDREGFRLIRHDSELTRAGDVNRLRAESTAYLEDLAPVIKDVMGASWVVPRAINNTGVVVRSATKISPGDPFYYTPNRGGIEIPYPNTHMDYTEPSALSLARAENHHRGLPERPYRRLIIIQAWQAISPPPQDRPLALMDASTLRPEDFFPVGNDPDPNDLSGEVFRARFVVHHPSQRWYYFSDMRHDEIVLFKGYDSENSATPPHGSFLNETKLAVAHPRESVEGRFFVYFE